jgi:thioredoxin 1
MSAVIHADDPQAFDTEVLRATGPVVVDFWAEWCGPCRMVAPELEALAAGRPDLKVVKVDVEANPTVAAQYGIRGIPTVALFRDGRPVATSVGAKPRRAIEADLGLSPQDQGRS